MQQRPNILFLFSDQHRAAAMSCAGDPNVQTPTLDQLAAEGVRFTNAYANSPMCAPFRASLYTGQYINNHGVNCLFKPLLTEHPVLPELLQAHGYHTSHMGKWHLSGGDCPSHFVSPYFRPGWDDWMGWENSNRPFQTEYSCGDMPLPIYQMDGYQTDVISDMTIDWIKNYSGNKPWFHVMSFEPPHPPFEAPPAYMERFADADIIFRDNVDRDSPKIEHYRRSLRAYYAQITNMDDNIARIIQCLKDTQQIDNTIICYFSDHGEMHGSHDRMHKEVPEQESSNIPFIVRYPPAVKAGLVNEAFISVVDFMPSLCGLLDIPVPDYVDGEDLSRCFDGSDRNGSEIILHQFDRPFFSFEEHHELHYRGIRFGDWKYIVHYHRERSRLFNLKDDPYEMHNRIQDPDCAEIIQDLEQRLRLKLDAIGDDFFSELASAAQLD